MLLKSSKFNNPAPYNPGWWKCKSAIVLKDAYKSIWVYRCQECNKFLSGKQLFKNIHFGWIGCAHCGALIGGKK